LHCNVIKHYSKLQYDIVQCRSRAQCNIAYYSAVWDSAIQYSAVKHSTVQYSPVHYITIQSSTTQYSTVQYSTTQYSIVQYNALLVNNLVWFVHIPVIKAAKHVLPWSIYRSSQEEIREEQFVAFIVQVVVTVR